MHSGDRHASLAHGCRTAFDRAGAYVAGGKNARAAGLQRSGRAVHPFPCGRAGDRMPGLDEALFIALDVGRQPVGAR